MKSTRQQIRVILGALIAVFALITIASPAHAVHRGTVAKHRDFPGLVGVLENNNQLCGGTLIAPDVVLSAAHCFITVGGNTEPIKITVRVGSDRPRSGGTVIGVKEIKAHPNFAPSLHGGDDFDLAVLYLKQKVDSKVVEIATLATSEPRGGSLLSFAGWGDISTGKQEIFPNRLRSARMTVMSKTDCAKKIGAEYGPNMACAYSKKKTRANYGFGDSGGPNYVNGKVVGVTSFQDNWKPAVFNATYTSQAQSWLQGIIKNR